MDVAVVATVVAIVVGLVTAIATVVRLRWDKRDRQQSRSASRLDTFTTREMYQEIRDLPEAERARFERQRESRPGAHFWGPSIWRLLLMVVTATVVAMWLVDRFVR